MHLAKNGMDVCKIYNWLQLYFYSVANEIKWWVFEGFFLSQNEQVSIYLSLVNVSYCAGIPKLIYKEVDTKYQSNGNHNFTMAPKRRTDS